ncbi:MAG: PAS domain S-box-containing protein, partial [Candidatus Latescibacterota bacterium]
MEPSDLPPILENAPDIVYAFDAEGHFLSLNLAVEPVLGYAREELLGRVVFDYMHPDDVESMRASMQESARARDTGMRLIAVRMLHKSGAVRYFEINRRLIFSGDSFVRSEGIARDISEQKIEQLYRQVVQEVREEVWKMGGSGDYDHLLVAIHAGLQALEIPFENCGINVVEHKGLSDVMRSRTLTRDGGWLTSDTVKAGDLINEWWRHGEVVYRPDLEVEDRFGERGYMQTRARIRAVVDVPFSHGTLAICSTTPNAFSTGNIGLLSDLANVLSEGFRRIGDLRSLALSEERYRTLVETPDFIVMLLKPDGTFQYISPQIKQWIGYAPEDFYADPKKSHEVVHPEDVDKVTAAFARAAAGQTPKSIEFRWRNKEGEERWAGESIFPVAGAEGSIHTV